MAHGSRQNLKLTGDTHPPEVEWDPDLDTPPVMRGAQDPDADDGQQRGFSKAAPSASARGEEVLNADRLSLGQALGWVAFAWLCFKLARR